MPPTKRGIYHNLKESKYTASNGEVVFFFSSRVYMQKFLNTYENHRLVFCSKLEQMTNDNKLNMETLADINLYYEIEKRGFYVWVKGVEVNWDDLNLYALRKMTLQKSTSWNEIEKPKLTERLKIMG